MSESDVSPTRRAWLKAAGLGVTAAAGLLSGCVAPDDTNGATRQAKGTARDGSGPAAPPGPGRMSLTQVADSLHRGGMRAETYVALLLDQAQAASGTRTGKGTVVALDADGALDLARRTDAARERGSALAPLAGTALLVSDSIDFAPLPVTSATPALKNLRPRASAHVPQALITQGMGVLGKTNLQELSLGATSCGGIFGDVRNPYDPARIAGGASGGAAAAVAAGLAPAALASEGLASAHVAAALCGAVAFRPTLGDSEQTRRYKLAGVALVSHTRDSIVPLARTVADVALLDASITGGTLARVLPLTDIRLGVPHRYFWEGLDPEVRRVMDGALAALKARGVTLVEADLPDIDVLRAATALPIQLYEMQMDFPAYLWETGGDVSFARVVDAVTSPEVKARLQQARGVSRADYAVALNQDRPKLIAAYRNYFARHRLHGTIVPTVPVIAPRRDGRAEGGAPGRDDETVFGLLTRNTDPGGMAGLPAVTLPAGMTAAGLPVGLTLDGPAGADLRLLGIGQSVQALLGNVPAPAAGAT